MRGAFSNGKSKKEGRMTGGVCAGACCTRAVLNGRPKPETSLKNGKTHYIVGYS